MPAAATVAAKTAPIRPILLMSILQLCRYVRPRPFGVTAEDYGTEAIFPGNLGITSLDIRFWYIPWMAVRPFVG
jgi:hypothetical protein